jgi:ubiquinone/menaquinone biosynthesis C-methylase UbiE
MPSGKMTTNRSRLDRYIAENVAQTVATLDQYSIERYDQFADHLPAGAINVLDVGCAEGRGGAELKTRRPEIVLTGLDCVPKRLRALPPAYSGRIEGLTTEIPLLDRSQDAVVAGEFIEHLYPDDVDQTLCEFQRILAVGGMLLMTTPNPDSLKLRLRRGTVLDVGHFTQHFHDVLSLRLRMHGFRRVKVRGSGKATRYFGEKIPFLSLYGSYLITALKI